MFDIFLKPRSWQEIFYDFEDQLQKSIKGLGRKFSDQIILLSIREGLEADQVSYVFYVLSLRQSYWGLRDKSDKDLIALGNLLMEEERAVYSFHNRVLADEDQVQNILEGLVKWGETHIRKVTRDKYLKLLKKFAREIKKKSTQKKLTTNQAIVVFDRLLKKEASNHRLTFKNEDFMFQFLSFL